ncbi:homocysteine S-methyltransferase family protein [Anaeromassilibacillus sp. SJQ-5]
MQTQTIRERLGKDLLFFDGAMGTMLQQAGLPQGMLPEEWNLARPEVIRDIHRQYAQAGCQILKTNTFGANRLKFGERTETVIAAAVGLAKEAAGQSGRDDVWVAMDIGPTGKLLQPLGELSFEAAYDLFAEMAAAGERAGADCLLIETMSDTYELKAAVLAAKEVTKLPVFATMIFDDKGKLLTGGDIAAAVALLEGLGVDALGFNCGLGPDQMKGLLPELMACASLPVIVNPNAGLPRSENGRTVFDVSPEAFAADMEAMAAGGAWLLGGCCGTTPAHLAAMIGRCRGITPPPVSRKGRTVVSSYAKAVTIGGAPVIVGERINPTGKARFKQALRENDMEYILREGIAQQESGAHVLDVNVGLPEIDETERMTGVVRALQGVTDLPLQIDTSDGRAMEAAMRLYNGKPLINSVNGKQESMDMVFPLVKKYGGVMVALTLDEGGIPETAEGRLRIAEKIVRRAEACGIDRRDILVDALTMTISTGAEAALVTLETVRRVKAELGVGTILGVSNISFGLPQRENINAAFYLMALQSGLDAAILNPNAEAMMKAYFSFRALSAQDEQCGAYIARYAGAAPAAAPTAMAAEMGLREAIVRGLKERAYQAAAAQVKALAPLDIINDQLIPALDQVGQGFEKGTLFLPQLLMSAEAAKAAFEALKAHMDAAGQPPVKKNKIILATVKGDIHDIGKNIVKVLLENYGYDVIDLGKDVDPALVAETARREKVRLCGLSALMTTTVAGMEETIRALRAAAPGCRVMVGGAVMTPEYAAQIGADRYAKDAMGAVHIAQELFGEE